MMFYSDNPLGKVWIFTFCFCELDSSLHVLVLILKLEIKLVELFNNVWFFSFCDLAATSCNTYTRTFTGIDGAGKRLAAEVSHSVSVKMSWFLGFSYQSFCSSFKYLRSHVTDISSSLAFAGHRSCKENWGPEKDIIFSPFSWWLVCKICNWRSLQW